MNRWASCLFLAVVAATTAVGADTYPRQAGFAVSRYTFEVGLSDANNEIAVTETVDVQFTAAGVTALEFDLCGVDPQRRPGPVADPCQGATAPPNPARRELSGAANVVAGPTGMAVSAVTAAGQPLVFTHQKDRLHVSLESASDVGGRASLVLSYRGVPATGLQIGKNRHGDRGFFSNDWPNLARNWLAVIDHPSMKAPTTMAITAPRQYQAISNGRLHEATDLEGGLRRTVWREDEPIPTWQIALGVAPFTVRYFGDFRGIPLSSWVYPQEAASARPFSDHTRRVLEFYSDRVGPYSYEKLAQVEATTVSGGMELASAIFYGYDSQPSRQVIAHETAHQWFGDSATERDWDDVWLSEGFATYFALLYTEHVDGRDAFVAGVKTSAQSAIRFALANPSSTIVHDNLADISKVIANNAQVYQGGAQVLHMLRGLMGDERFWAGIRLYYARHANGNATSDDFRRAMEDACRAAGECPSDLQDLSWFFRQWLRQGGLLQVRGTWHYDEAAKTLTVSVEQTQTTGLYRMPIEVGVVTAPAPAAAPAFARGQTRAANSVPPVPTLLLTGRTASLTIPLDREPTDVVLDPRSWVTLMQASLVKQ